MPCVPESASEILSIRSRERDDALDITERVQDLVERTGLRDGVCQVYVPHTTAGIFINENADPAVLRDLFVGLDRLVPWESDYSHAEGNAAAHIKAILTGGSQLIPVRAGRLALGRWQGIFFIDFDGPRERQVRVTVLRA